MMEAPENYYTRRGSRASREVCQDSVNCLPLSVEIDACVTLASTTIPLCLRCAHDVHRRPVGRWRAPGETYDHWRR